MKKSNKASLSLLRTEYIKRCLYSIIYAVKYALVDLLSMHDSNPARWKADVAWMCGHSLRRDAYTHRYICTHKEEKSDFAVLPHNYTKITTVERRLSRLI